MKAEPGSARSTECLKDQQVTLDGQVVASKTAGKVQLVSAYRHPWIRSGMGTYMHRVPRLSQGTWTLVFP